MFILGSTGQLITLILTVCLPFVFLVSGNQKTDVLLPSDHLIVSQNQIEINTVTTNNLVYSEDLIIEEKNDQVVFTGTPILKFPDNNNFIRWKSVFSKSSGNKAPPASISFSC